MSTINYAVSDVNGNALARISTTEEEASKIAQCWADQTGAVVVLRTEGAEDSEEFAPTGEGYTATADGAEPSAVSDAPALDVCVTLTLPTGMEVSGDCTLWPHLDGRPGYGTCGTPLEGWMGGALYDAVYAISSKRARDAAIEAVLDVAKSACAVREVD